jgi:hypothetical protein
LLQETDGNRSRLELEMRLVPKHRRRQRDIASRIEISQAEITADLTYRGEERRAASAPAVPVRGRQ